MYVKRYEVKDVEKTNMYKQIQKLKYKYKMEERNIKRGSKKTKGQNRNKI